MEYSEKENIEEYMKTVHSQSAIYSATKQTLQQLFPSYDLKYELLNYTFIAVEGDYVLARVKQRTRKVSGPAFRNNIIDMIQIFKMENGIWKYWQQAILDIIYIK